VAGIWMRQLALAVGGTPVMGFRMYCSDCGATDFPVTRLEGSDTVESLGWLMGGLPGWLYCAWRHALRTKLCANCGSASLIRESRASRARAAWPVPPRFSPIPTQSRAALVVWSGPLQDPRRRLLSGTPWIAAWLFAGFGFGSAGAAVALACILVQAICAASWEEDFAESADSPWGHGPGHCHAWDAQGRPLRIELFPCLDPEDAALPRISWKAINSEPIA
jgi:hypothetical protein